MMVLMYLAFLVISAAGFVGPAQTCTPGIEFVQDYFWDPPGPVSICVFPEGEARAFLAGGQPVTAALRFPVIRWDTVPVAFSLVPVEWYSGGPGVICEPHAAELFTDSEGWVTWIPDIQGGGHRGPDDAVDLTLWIPVCPNQQLDILEGVYFNSPDINGDLSVNLSDVPDFAADFFGAYDYRSDFNWDNVINLSDIVFMAQSLGVACE
jgi:hypothetical protein